MICHFSDRLRVTSRELHNLSIEYFIGVFSGQTVLT
jgi:hypothetical protein